MRRLAWCVIPALLAAPGLCGQARGPASPMPAISGQQAAELDRDQLMRAVVLETLRTRLLVGFGVAPYFVEASVDDAENIALAASFGVSYAPQRTRFRLPRTAVRVGSMELDNTGYIGSDFFSGERFGAELLPIDNDLLSLRTTLWLAFDHAYKRAVEALGRKQSALQFYASKERPPDFSPAPRLTVLGDLRKPAVDEARWSERVRALSGAFRGRPGVVAAEARLIWSPGNYYYFNSEGTGARVPDALAMLRLRAVALLPGGGEVYHGVQFAGREPSALPADAELKVVAERTVRQLEALVKAPAGEAYDGPVLFDAVAAAQLFADVFGQELMRRRKPVAEQGRDVPVLESALEHKIGARVLPAFLSLRDNAALKQWKGQPLAGYYDIDLEGVTPQAVTLVEHGILKGFLTTRQPAGHGEVSNGHARLPGAFGAQSARISNLLVDASASVPEAQLRTRLIELVKQQNRPYGVLVRRMDFPSLASAQDIRAMAVRQARTGAAGRLYSAPLLLYRVYPDGSEVLERGLRFRALNIHAFRDIVAAGDQPAVFSYADNGAPMAMDGGGTTVIGCSVVAPAVLFEELELEPVHDEAARPPLVPPPAVQ